MSVERILDSFEFEWGGQPYRAELRQPAGSTASTAAIWVLCQEGRHATAFVARQGETRTSVRLALIRQIRRYHSPKTRVR